MIVMVMMAWIEVTRESETEDHQCDKFLIRAQICKKYSRGTSAFFAKKYKRYTSKNSSADSRIFNFLIMARIAFLLPSPGPAD